uniref:Venom peptide n=1 Tax=Steinernema glaseri TaxID=37863 RepID=A0A1I7Z1G9_9BILA
MKVLLLVMCLLAVVSSFVSSSEELSKWKKSRERPPYKYPKREYEYDSSEEYDYPTWIPPPAHLREKREAEKPFWEELTALVFG